LTSERTKTTSCTDNGSELARLDTRLFQTLVNSNTGAENRGNSSEVTLLGNAGNVGSFGDAVLLEGAIDSISREKWFRAEGLVCLLAEVA
jgi:hypothetical protein